MTGCGILELVLYRFEEILSLNTLCIIIDRESKNIFDLLIESSFTCADIADPFEQLVEVIRSELLRVSIYAGERVFPAAVPAPRISSLMFLVITASWISPINGKNVLLRIRDR